MTDRPIEPSAVVQMIESYVDDELRDKAKYSNREPLDESGVYTLHTLAARIYQLGFNDGRFAESVQNDGERRRARERASQEGDAL